MDVTKPYEFIGFGAMGVTKAYEFIRLGPFMGGCQKASYGRRLPGGRSPFSGAALSPPPGGRLRIGGGRPHGLGRGTRPPGGGPAP
jgi:hypothetical protein